MKKHLVDIMVSLSEDDGRFYFDIKIKNGVVNNRLVRSILSGAVALSIRGEESPELQGQALRDVVNYLESELINYDSFNDVYIYNKK